MASSLNGENGKLVIAATRWMMGVVACIVVFAAGCGSWQRDCPKEEGCRKLGLCFPTYGTCIAEKNEHCQAAEICLKEGKCAAAGGVCVSPTSKDGKIGEERPKGDARPDVRPDALLNPG